MRTHRATALAVGVMLLTASAPVVSGATPDLRAVAPPGIDRSALARTPSGPVVATGSVIDATGKRAAGGMVAAVAWPASEVLETMKVGDSLTTRTIGWAVVRADGTWTLKVDPSTLTGSYVAPDGSLNLDFVAWDATSTGWWAAPVFLSQDDVVNARGKTASSAPPATKAAGNVEVALTAALAEPLAGTATQSVRTTETSAPVVAAACAPGSLVWDLLSTQNTKAAIGATWPSGTGQTGNMKTSTGHDTSIGVGFSVSGASGSFGLNGMTTMNDSVGAEWNYSGNYRIYRAGVQYGKYGHRWCGASYYEYQARAIGPTGTFDSLATTNKLFTHCDTQGAGTWSRETKTGTSYTLTTGVELSSLIGVDLKSSSTWTTTHTLYYKFTQTGHLCGSDALPATASQVNAKN